MGERYSSSTEQTNNKQQELLVRLEEAIDAIHDSDSFRRYLDVQSRFHHYSAGNAVLIMLQRPDATIVAGYQRWLTMNRRVRRGENGIAIMVPHLRKVEKDGEEKRKLMGFGIGYVFDVRQTEGEPLPSVEIPVLKGEEGRELFGHLESFVASEGVRLAVAHPDQLPPETMGYYAKAKREIVIARYPQLQMTKTLAHEAAHHVHLSRFGEESTERAERETVAEAAAYVVLGHHGLDSGARSFPYIGVWSQDQGKLRAAMDTIQKVSKAMITGIEHARQPAV